MYFFKRPTVLNLSARIRWFKCRMHCVPSSTNCPSPAATKANNKKWRVANSCAIKCKKGIGNLGHCGGHRSAHYALIERRRLKLLPRNGNGIVPQKLKLSKQQQSGTVRGGKGAKRGIGAGVGNVTGNGQQSFNINAIYSSNFAFYVRAQYLTHTHTHSRTLSRTHACVYMCRTEKSCARSCRIMPYWGSLGCLKPPSVRLCVCVCVCVHAAA